MYKLYYIEITVYKCYNFQNGGFKMIDCKSKTCCFTGHRDIPQENLKGISLSLEKTLVDLIEKGYRYFGAGGALGFDTLAAQMVLKLKIMYPYIKLILVLPCENQAEHWKAENKIIYEDIKSKTDKAVYTSKTYFKGCMHKRNRHLVDNSSSCVCYLTTEKDGTAYTVHYAKKC